MYRTIHESVTFSQEIQEGSSVATTTIAIKSYTNAIDDITNAYVSFLRALDFMDCQIIEELEDQLDNLKERRTFELSQVEEDTTTEEDEDEEEDEEEEDDDAIPLTYDVDDVYRPYKKDPITFG